MTLRVRIPAAASLAASLLWTGAVSAQESRGGSTGYEMWIVDQSDTKGQNHGGALYVFTASDLKLGALSSSKPGTVAVVRERADEGPKTGVMLTARRP